MSEGTLLNLIGGEWVPSNATETLPVVNPTTGATLAECPLGTAADVDAAVQAARTAFTTWRKVPAVDRAGAFPLQGAARRAQRRAGQDLHQGARQDLHGVAGQRASWHRKRRACVRHSGADDGRVARRRRPRHRLPHRAPADRRVCGGRAVQLPGDGAAVVLALRDRDRQHVHRQAVRAGAAVDQAHDGAGAAGGHAQHGARWQGHRRGALRPPRDRGAVLRRIDARIVYERAAKTGKRVQSLGGAKNHIIVMPDAPTERGVRIAIDSVFGCAGQRCHAGSVVVGVGDGYDALKEGLVRAANEIVVGDGMKEGVSMGPVISPAAKERISKATVLAESEGGKILVDGRNQTVEGCEGGNGLGPTLIENVTADMNLAKEEVFGPVMALRKAADLDEAIGVVQASQFANACSIVTDSGGAARQFKYEVGVSMLGVNIGVAAPMAFFPFGGTKASLFGDLKAHGSDSIRFFTDAKVVISRWS